MLNVSTEKLHLTNSLYTYVGAFVDELQRAGVHHAVICPGSRSTPLAITLAAQPGLRAWMHVDERSAAFFALGLAKRLVQPVALLCTSGTAAANFLPALVEAGLTHVPLLRRLSIRTGSMVRTSSGSLRWRCPRQIMLPCAIFALSPAERRP